MDTLLKKIEDIENQILYIEKVNYQEILDDLYV